MNRNERLITLVMLQAAQRAGWVLEGLYDGEQHNRGITEAAALELANNLDDCVWMFGLPKEKAADGKRHSGNVSVIFGNGDDGLTVISDHHLTLSKFQDFATDKPEAEREVATHGCGFMEEVDAFRDELEAYYQGQDACHPGPSAKYLARDRLELAAPQLVETLLWIVREHGNRAGDEDRLKPPENQDSSIIAEAMLALRRAGVAWQ